MNASVDHTHDVAARSWLPSANAAGTDFPIQSLPFAVFRRAGEAFRGGVAIGDQVLDLAALARSGRIFEDPAAQALAAAAKPALNDFLALGRPHWRALRHALFALLKRDAESHLFGVYLLND